MPKSKSGEESLAARSMVTEEAHKDMEKNSQKHFDSYEECGCVDRWEAEGGPVVGEDQRDTSAG